MSFILQTVQSTGLPPTLREIAAHFQWKAVGSVQDVVLALRKKGALQPAVSGKSRQLVPTEHGLALMQNQLNWDSDKEPPRTRKVQRNYPGGAVRPHQDDNFFAGNLMSVPLLGAVQAGAPALRLDNHAGEVVSFARVTPRTPGASFFALTVEGFSMMNAGLIPGDVLLVESTPHAKNGDIVVAALGNEVTVKRLAQRGSQLYRSGMDKLKQSQAPMPNAPTNFLIPENDDFKPIAFGDNEDHRIVGLVRSLYRAEIS